MRKRNYAAHARRRSSAARTRRPKQVPALGVGRWLLLSALGCCLVLLIWGISSARPTPVLSAAQQKQQVLQHLLDAGHTHSQSGIGPTMPVPTDPPPQPPQAGIINAPQQPFSPAVFKARNAWQGPVGSEWVIAYAGAQTNPDGTSGRGGLMLYRVGSFALEYIGTYLAPAGTTALTIIQWQGDLLRLEAASGQMMTFNLQSRQYQ